MNVPKSWRLLLLLGCGTLVAQNAAPSPETATVDGVILKQGTTDPIQGTVVSLTPETGVAKTATSSADGKFTISELPPGRYTISLTRSGFAHPRRSSGPTNLSLVAGEHLKDVTLRLAVTGVITGHVFDENGKPKNHVSVVPVRPHYEYGRKVMSPFNAEDVLKVAVTDAAGAYRIFGLEPGEYYLTWCDGTCSTEYYPGVVDPEDAVLMKIQSGTELSGIDFHLKPKTLYSAHFKLVLPPPLTSNTPRPKTQTMRHSRNGIDTENLSTSTPSNRPIDGVFTTPGLLPGSYELFYDNYSGVQIGHIAFDIVNRDVDAGTMVIRSAIALGGQIRAAGALPNGWTFSKARILLRPLDGRDKSLTTTPNSLSTAAADGTFLIAIGASRGSTERPGSVPDGRYLIEMSGLLPDMYIASARYGGHDALAEGLIIDGDPSGPLEIMLDTGGSVEGVVQNAKGEPVANSRVVIVPAQNRRGSLGLFKSAFTDQHGTFSIRGVAPGDYGILAWEDVESGAWLNADFLKEFEARSTKVTILGKSTSNSIVRVIPVAN